MSCVAYAILNKPLLPVLWVTTVKLAHAVLLSVLFRGEESWGGWLRVRLDCRKTTGWRGNAACHFTLHINWRFPTVNDWHSHSGHVFDALDVLFCKSLDKNLPSCYIPHTQFIFCGWSAVGAAREAAATDWQRSEWLILIHLTCHAYVGYYQLM